MKYYFNASSEYCDKSVELYVHNLTSSYTDQRNEAPMVATSVVMFVLAALFFNLNLFSRFSDVSAILNPSVRLFLNTSLSLFLPAMSYLFSEAKNDRGGGQTTAAELSVRARTILLWMLLVELLRRKVEAILVTAAGAQGYSGTIERATRIAWLGYLVFCNLRSAGKKALYGILWVFAAAKMVQRLVSQELGKRSFAYGKNPQLLSSYMAKMLQHQRDGGGGEAKGSELLKRCNYAVMGEEELEREAGPGGYDLASLAEAVREHDSSVVTVGKIWQLAADDDKNDKLLRTDARLKRLCLSFALCKLLRRRLEDFPISGEEARSCHDLIFKGLCEEEAEEGGSSRALFQVLNDEVQFLCEYYHSVQPVVFASPFFFVNNYILFPAVVWALSVLTIILCSNGDVRYAFRSFQADNYAVSVGVVKLMGCILPKITTSPPELFTVVDVSVTGLLLLALAYEEVWELVVFLLSNWFMVSLVCSYTSKPRWRDSPWLSGVIRRILWVRNRLSHPNVCVKQLSLLWCHGRRLPSALPTKAVPLEAKKALMHRLASAGGDGAPLSNGRSALHHHHHQALRWACEGGGIAEVILTWHLATEMLAARHPAKKQKPPATTTGGSSSNSDRKMAMALSRYGAYLVAFHPELLPDETDGTKRVYRETKEALRRGMGWLGYYCGGQGARLRKLTEMAGQEDATTTMTALGKGARLGKALIERATGREEAGGEPVWKLVAEVWTEVVAYAAPTGSEQHVRAHREALALGGEFITLLWALTTHTGITARRGPPVVATPAADPPAAAALV